MLHLVVQYGSKDLMKLVTDQAKDLLELEKTNEYHHTALWIALSNYQFDIADVLLQNGADINTTNRYGLTIWYKHAKLGRTNILRALKRDRGNKPQWDLVHSSGKKTYQGTPLQAAVLAGEAKFVKSFVIG